MSYLGQPRLNFSGRFQADISTVNNLNRYYDITRFEPRFHRFVRMNGAATVDVNGLFNPRGTGAFRLADITVNTGLGPDGTIVDTTAADPVIGGRLADDDRRPNAKMVDLDQRQQTVSGIYGLRLRVLDTGGRELLRGDYVPSWIDDLWQRGPGTTLPGGANISASYQSVLENVRFADGGGSPLVDALRAATRDDRLSIKWALDGYIINVYDILNPDHTFGRMVGSIGPYESGEPKRMIVGRRLRQQSGAPLSHSPCRVDEDAGKVFLDLSNSWPTTSIGGPLRELGALRLALLRADGTPEILGPITEAEPGAWQRLSGIAAVPLTAEQVAATRQRRLAVVDAAEPPAVLLAENADGSWVRADEFVFRLAPGDPTAQATTTLLATRFGRPAPGEPIAVAVTAAPAALSVPDRVITGPDGRARLTLTGTGPPANPVMDGVVAEARYAFASRPAEPEGRVVALVFSDYRAPARPTWNRDVWPIFQQYANLYPVMGGVFDLGNYHHVVQQSVYVKRTLLASVDSPNHMPVSRDLSPGKRDMILKWLTTKPTPPVLEIDDVAELRSVLQQALLVEQAVIPPYSAALFSIKPGRNTEIGALIRGVLLEEMQHMAQVANILNAIGGKPQIGRPGMVPTYPGKLPGPVLPDLQVRLRRLSIEHVERVFMEIEKPQFPRVDGREFRGAVIAKDSITVDRSGKLRTADDTAMETLREWFVKAEYEPMTIGWFYNQIAKALIRLGRRGGLFTGDPALQVAWPDAPGTLFQVTDLRSALLGLYQIIEQGEGSPHDLDGDGIGDPEELGHYYRFEEIVKGRQLVRNARGRWVYEGPPIPFDPDGVHPVVDDADSYRLAGDSVGRRESLRCDQSYTDMLTSLHRVFNGFPAELDDAVGLMGQLQVQAKRLYEIPATEDGSAVLGPAFQSPA